MAISSPKKTPKTKTRKNAKNANRKARIPVSECVGYVRVSTSEQADSGLSLESQRAKIKAQCEANDWTLIGIYEDAGISAKTLNRPALREALAELKPGRVLLAAKLDRFTRSVRDLYELTALINHAGAEWASVMDKFDTSTATGRLMLGIMIELAQWEREIIAERTIAALGEKKVRGERLGTTPLGYRTIEGADGEKFVVEDEGEMKIVRLVRQWSDAGHSLRQIAAQLTEQGYKTKRGGKWGSETVRLLLQKRYLETINAPT